MIDCKIIYYLGGPIDKLEDVTNEVILNVLQKLKEKENKN